MVEHYSLTSVVLGQLRMIHNARHQPVLIGLEDFKWQDAPHWVEIRAGLPFYHKKDYQSITELGEEHIEIARATEKWLTAKINDLDALFSHDILFTGWNLPLNVGMQSAAPYWPFPHFHWVHSVPGGRMREFWRVPPNGKLVYPNHQDRIRCAEHFNTWQEDVLVIPHSKDPREFLFRTDLATRLVTRYQVLAADIVQTYPIPTDRFEPKGSKELIEIFGRLKHNGKTVKLIFCNSWCNTDERRSDIGYLINYAFNNGLTDEEVIFTSRFSPAFEVGVPQTVVSDLMGISNLFVCPSKSESFGYTVAEAALCGQLLVLNQNLPMFQEVAGPGGALHFTFGSYQQEVSFKNRDKYYDDVAKIIIHTMDHNHALRAKTWYRQQYRWEAVWHKLEQVIAAHRLVRA